MKSHLKCSFFLLSAVPVALSTGCNLQPQPQMQRCVDFSDHVVADSLCVQPRQAVKVPGSLHMETLYRPYYGGFGNYVVGTKAWGGSDKPLSGYIYQPDPTRELPNHVAVDNSPQPYTMGPSH